MGMFDDLLSDFGRRLGLNSLTPGSGGGADLAIEQVGRLQMEENGDWLLVTLARPARPHASGSARALLEAAHWRENHPWAVHPGMKGNEWLTLTARVRLAGTDVPELERIVEFLTKLHDAAGAAGQGLKG